MTAVQTGARRERVRAATIAEIKQTALAQMHEHGTTNVRFTDIARVMGMTPPALYRYFADRDELLTALITDAYENLGTSIAEALAAQPEHDFAGRWLAGAQAYRQWAKQEPQQFALIFGLPVPGYVAPDEGVTTEAAKRAMGQLAALFVAAREAGQLRRPAVTEIPATIEECAVAKSAELGAALPPEIFQGMLHAWASLHGFVSLEAYGHFEWMGPQARDALFLSHMVVTAGAAGLPVPQ